MKHTSHAIPEAVSRVAATIAAAGFEVYLVGGCVRDVLLDREPKDWDLATNATPEEVQKLFPDTVYENQFGTVGVKTPTPEGVGAHAAHARDEKLKVVEVTTFRIEGKYTDARHPDEVRFAKTIEEDLSRRDFTINAMAMALDGTLVDPHSGRDDLERKLVRAVGDPHARFQEDALRLMRAVRFAVELEFELDRPTREAIRTHAGLLEAIAKERIRDEFFKMIMARRAADGMLLLEDLDLLRHVLPELRDGLGVGQNLHHIYTVFEHNVRALDYSAKENHSLGVRLAALLHDAGKPQTKRGEGTHSTFHGHEVVSAKMAARALDRLRAPKELVEQVAHLVRYHMFYYNVGEVSEAGVRRFLARVGPEYVDDLLKLREADRIGSGTPKAVPYKLRHLLFMIEKVKHDPMSPKMLALRGEEVMRIAGIAPGPKVGQILDALLEEVIDDPSRNTAAHLEARAKELAALPDAELQTLREKARARKDEFEAGVEEEMKKQFFVQ